MGLQRIWVLQNVPGFTGQKGNLWLTEFESHQYYRKKIKQNRFLTAGFSALNMLTQRESPQKSPISSPLTKPFTHKSPGTSVWGSLGLAIQHALQALDQDLLLGPLNLLTKGSVLQAFGINDSHGPKRAAWVASFLPLPFPALRLRLFLVL